MSSFGDFNRVNTNLTAMDAQLSLNKINRDLGESRLRLSTGFKINNAEDDAAGFAIANKLKSRVAGLEQSLQNVADAKSVLGIVEGAYGSIIDNLIEMKALATQGANETLGADERTYIAKQINALSVDINDISDSTTFNGLEMLDSDTVANGGDGKSAYNFQVGEGIADVHQVTLNDVDISALFTTAAIATTKIVVSTAASDLTGGTEARGQIDFSDDDAASPAVVDAEASDFRALITEVDTAISTMNGYMNQVGIDQRTLSSKETSLTEAITANSAARSRIMDTDFAKEQSNSIRLQILQQTATAALSQANMGPQAVLGFLG